MNAAPITLASKPTFLEYNGMRFLITDAPREHNLHSYIQEAKKYAVTDMVRVCEPTYDASEVEAAGILMHNMEYDDGTSPPDNVIMSWLELIHSRFLQRPGSSKAKARRRASATGDNSSGTSNGAGAGTAPCVAVHCVAGLGRAPVLVAIALMEFGRMSVIEAVEFIRQRRRGAINMRQLVYLEEYKPKFKSGGGCMIS